MRPERDLLTTTSSNDTFLDPTTIMVFKELNEKLGLNGTLIVQTQKVVEKLVGLKRRQIILSRQEALVTGNGNDEDIRDARTTLEWAYNMLMSSYLATSDTYAHPTGIWNIHQSSWVMNCKCAEGYTWFCYCMHNCEVQFPEGLDELNKIQDQAERIGVYEILIGLYFLRLLIINRKDEVALEDFELLQKQFRARHNKEYKIIWQWIRGNLKDELIEDMRDRIEGAITGKTDPKPEPEPLDPALLLL